MCADELDPLIRKISMDVYKKHNVALTAIGIYSVNTKDADAIFHREKISKLVLENPYILQVHGFYIDQAAKTIRFDIVISFDAKDRRQVYREILEKVQKEYPDYTLQVFVDTDFSEGS